MTGSWESEGISKLTKKVWPKAQLYAKQYFPDINLENISLLPSKIIHRKIITRNVKPWDHHAQHRFCISNKTQSQLHRQLFLLMVQGELSQASRAALVLTGQRCSPFALFQQPHCDKISFCCGFPEQNLFPTSPTHKSLTGVGFNCDNANQD